MEVSSWENHLFLWAICHGYVSHNQRVVWAGNGLVLKLQTNIKPFPAIFLLLLDMDEFKRCKNDRTIGGYPLVN